MTVFDDAHRTDSPVSRRRCAAHLDRMTTDFTTAIRQAIDEDSWDGHAEPLNAKDLDRLAAVAARAAAIVVGDLIAPTQELVSRWEAEAADHGPEDRLMTSGVVGMLGSSLAPLLAACEVPGV